MSSLTAPHFAIFPFMSQGYTIPLLYLSRLLRRRSAFVTIFTTAGNSPFIRGSLKDIDVSIVELPFPQNIEGVPSGVENTSKLPSMSSFIPFANSTKLMQKSFEKALEKLNPPVSCIISDVLLGWTIQSAERFGVPRLVFWPMGFFFCTMYHILGRDDPHVGTNSLDEPFSMPDFPEIKLTRNDFDPPFNQIEPSGPNAEFLLQQTMAMTMSQGMIVNTFYEFEKCYIDYWNKKIGPKVFCVGPLCTAAAQPQQMVEKPFYIQFLDKKLAEGQPVLYVAFGTEAEVSAEQFQEIAEGLEQSQVSFLLALRQQGLKSFQGFEERVKNRGILVREWVDQLQILKHQCVKGFLSNCGWNSVLESISNGVPILARPFMSDQPLNTRFVEKVGVGLRFMPSSGSIRGFVVAEEVERMVREIMDGEKGAEARRKAAEYGNAACDAVKEGGTSARTLDLLIHKISGKLMSFSDEESDEE